MIKWLNNNKTYIANFFMLFAIMTLTYYLLFRDKEIGSIIQVIKSANTFWVVIGVIFMFLFIALEAVIINYLMKSLGKKIRYIDSLKYSMIGFFFSAITPSASGGQPMQVLYMKRDKHDISASSLVLLIITVFYKFVIFLMSIAMLIFSSKFIFEYLREPSIRYLFYFGIGANAIVIIGFMMIIFMKKTSEIIIDKIINIALKFKYFRRKKGLRERVDNSLKRYHEGADYFKNHKKVLFNVFIITLLQRCSMFFVTYCVYKSFGLSEYNVIQIIMMQCVIAITIDILPFPGGAGICESCFLSIFRMIFTEYYILPAMMLYRGITFYLYVLITGLVLCGIHICNRKKLEEE